MLLRILCARHHGATVKELAGELGVGEKTIRRDLAAFQTAGFPLLETTGQFGRKSYRIDPRKNLTKTHDRSLTIRFSRPIR
jgi:predicted DNA-binding transcriptional regulator YafY